MHEEWLIHIDRICLPIWRTLLAKVLLKVGEEVGEGYRIVTVAKPVGLDELQAFGLLRFAMPVRLRLPAGSLGRRDASAVWEKIRLGLDPGGSMPWVWFPMRRHGARIMTTFLHEHPLAAPGIRRDEEIIRQDTPHVVAAVSDKELFWGIVSRHASGAPFWGGHLPGSKRPAGLSRARAKLVEALALAASLGVELAPGRHWLELGAFPGGMTEELLERDQRVSALDKRARPQLLASASKLHWYQTDVETFVPTVTYDALLCDINGSPLVSARAVARLSAWLADGGLLIHTIKLPDWLQLASVVRQVSETLDAAGIGQLAMRHFSANRQELTFLGRKNGLRARVQGERVALQGVF